MTAGGSTAEVLQEAFDNGGVTLQVYDFIVDHRVRESQSIVSIRRWSKDEVVKIKIGLAAHVRSGKWRSESPFL
jgi:hypothetical protein